MSLNVGPLCVLSEFSASNSADPTRHHPQLYSFPRSAQFCPLPPHSYPPLPGPLITCSSAELVYNSAFRRPSTPLLGVAGSVYRLRSSRIARSGGPMAGSDDPFGAKWATTLKRVTARGADSSDYLAFLSRELNGKVLRWWCDPCGVPQPEPGGRWVADAKTWRVLG